MMNKRIRSMIDEIFSEMKMTAENLALRDELMANAQARYEDVIAQGGTEEEAVAGVAASLEDVSELLREMNGDAPAEKPAQEPGQEPEQKTEQEPEQETKQEPEPEREAAAEGGEPELDIGDALNKAFSALSDFGRSIMPQAKKIVRQMDDATGGAIKSVGKAVGRSVKDAQKAAGEAIDRMSENTGEIILDFGKRETPRKEDEAAKLRREAEDLRAQAGFKRVTGDAESAQELMQRADELCARAQSIEQEAAMQEAVQAAKRAEEEMKAQMRDEEEKFDTEGWATPEEAAEAAAQRDEEMPVLEEKHEPLLDEDGDVNEDAFTRVVEQIQRDTKKMVDDAAAFAEDMADRLNGQEKESQAEEADYTVRNAQEATSGRQLFPAAGLRDVDIELDADDVRVEVAEGDLIETVWSARNVDGEPEIVMDGHKLKIRRKNPDVFKTFFSVFSKNGGQMTVRVPRGYAADYRIATTSGDIYFGEVDADSVKASSTSGGIRLEPNASMRADLVKADTVSGAITVSACANDVKAQSVSGSLFISCDADKVEADTVSGKVHIEGACDTWDVDSVSGSVELICTVPPTRKIDIDTTSATARVALPSEIRGFAAKLSGMSGKIVNEFGPDRYGTCALPIQMDSISGSLMITRL
ncbi:MAG: DUF4097 family beta strand repeat protein [Clostridia bacterium]|nr:DUF4097 family beta strand repeat protein [Clostridia bacterium]